MKDLTHEEQAGLYLCQPTIRKENCSVHCKDDIQTRLLFHLLMGREDTVSSNPDRRYWSKSRYPWIILSMQFLPLLYISNAILLFYSPFLRVKFSSTGWSSLPGWFGWSDSSGCFGCSNWTGFVPVILVGLIFFLSVCMVGILDLIGMVGLGDLVSLVVPVVGLVVLVVV